MQKPRDPGDIVTPYAFRVAPDVLGLPLAGPFRRGAAMLVDLLLVAVLLLVKEISATLLGFVFAWILFKASSPRAREGVTGPVARPLVRAGAYAILLISLVSFGSCFLGFIGSDAPTPTRVRVAGEGQEGFRGAELGARELMAMGAAVAQITSASDSASAQRPTDRFAIALARGGMTREEREEARGGDSELPVGALPPEAAEALEAAAETQSEARDRPRPERERNGSSGFTGFLETIAEDLGIGFGWAGAYFTLFLVLMSGQTPGKRLLGCRVIHLNGTPIGWWSSFERFGGYAAGLATGLLGFLEIFWNANRQGVHDRISGTVVVRTPGSHVTLDRESAGRATKTPTGTPTAAHPQAPRTG